jgi:uncharacterized protein (TIGR03118 family)
MRARSLSFAALTLCAGVAQAGHYRETDLVSNGAVPARFTDGNLVNPWGLASSPTGPWWVANNGAGVSTLYNGDGEPQSLVVLVPGAPTGLVFNDDTDAFVVRDHHHNKGAAVFIFASEDGTISAWSPAVPPPAPSRQAFVVYDESDEGAVYKGLALAHTHHGARLYATDFHNNRVQVLDERFDEVELCRGKFQDPRLPDGYAPFGIAVFDHRVIVTYALQNDEKHDDVAGPGHGFIDEYDTDGELIRRIASEGALNSPWGLAIAPDDFGRFSGDLLVGNFGDGRINAYEPRRFHAFEHEGALENKHGEPIEIDGLWSIKFGNGAAAGPTNTLFFTAGINDEADGLFGSIRAARY